MQRRTTRARKRRVHGNKTHRVNRGDDDDDAKEHRERKVMVAAGHWHGIGISIAHPMHDAPGRERERDELPS